MTGSEKVTTPRQSIFDANIRPPFSKARGKKTLFKKKKKELCAHQEADAATSQSGRGFS